MSNYTSENLISIPASSIHPGTLAIKIGTDYFQAAGAVIGTDVSDTTATAITVLGGYEFYDSAGVKTSGTIPTVSAATITPTTSNQIISSGVYLGGEQTILGDANLVGSNILSGVSIFGVPGTLVTSAGAEVTLGYISSGMFQPLTFSGTSAYNGGSAVNLSCYNWNLPGSATSSGVIINSGVISSVLSGEIWENTTVNSGGWMYVSSGGMANKTVVNGGYMLVYKGATAYSAIVNPGGSIFVDKGATATIIENGGSASVVGDDITFIPNTISGLTLSTRATLHSATNAISTTINSGGELSVSSGGLADSTTVNPGGSMHVTSGGTATAILENGGYVNAYYTATFIPNTISGLTLSGMVTLHSATNAVSTTLSGWMYLSGGTAVSTTVDSGGIGVFSGGTAVSTTVNSGSIGVYYGGTATDFTTDKISFAIASNTYAFGTYKGSAFEIGNSSSFSDFTVSSGCQIQVYNGYTLNSITVLESGYISVYPGGSASNINIFSGGSVTVVVNSSTYFQGTSGGSSFLISGGHVSNLVAAYGYNLYISSGGTASDITTYYNFSVYSGGTATNVNINGNGTEINSGAIASGMTVNSSGLMRIRESGVASNTTVNFGGVLYAEPGCTMNYVTVSSGGTMYRRSGSVINNLTSMTGAVIINS